MATEKRRKAILRAAESLFLSRRFDQVTLDDVCRKASVGKGTIYRYFDSKEDLLAEVILTGMDDLYELMKCKTERAKSPEGKLLATAKALQDFYRRHGMLFRSLHAEWLRGVFRGSDLHKEMTKRRERTAKLVASIMRAGQKERIYRRDLPAGSASSMFLSVIRAAVMSRHGRRAGVIPLKQVVSVFVNGIRTR